MLTAGSYSLGNRSITGLDWYNAPDPRPDYYRYLPSYQLDPFYAEQVRQELLTNVNKRQINWDALYQTNYAAHDVVHNANGIRGNDVAGRRSRYIVEESSIKNSTGSITTKEAAQNFWNEKVKFKKRKKNLDDLNSII